MVISNNNKNFKFYKQAEDTKEEPKVQGFIICVCVKLYKEIQYENKQICKVHFYNIGTYKSVTNSNTIKILCLLWEYERIVHVPVDLYIKQIYLLVVIQSMDQKFQHYLAIHELQLQAVYLQVPTIYLKEKNLKILTTKYVLLYILCKPISWNCDNLFIFLKTWSVEDGSTLLILFCNYSYYNFQQFSFTLKTTKKIKNECF